MAQHAYTKGWADRQTLSYLLTYLVLHGKEFFLRS